MKIRINKNYLIISLAILVSIFFAKSGQAQELPHLSGRILLQVEEQGQAWYVNPLDNHRYYLGRPADAFELMRTWGLGVSNSDLESLLNKTAPQRLAGRILLQVEDKGQAYYINPLTLKLFYLGRPADAFALMRQQALGISNQNLARIPQAKQSLKEELVIESQSASHYYNFKYQNQAYQVGLDLSAELFKVYQKSPKTLYYPSNQPPANPRESFYGLFLSAREGDQSLINLIKKLEKLAEDKHWSSDQFLEFALALVQYIPYDNGKVENLHSLNTNPYYPYETLYLNKGVCSDKVFLGLKILRHLGYGAAILDFPEINHSALGVACPREDSLRETGYCYIETTNYFPLGVIPQSISDGRVQNISQENNFFNDQGLGELEIYQTSSGLVYQGLDSTKQKIANFQRAQNELTSLELELTTSLEVLKVKKEELDKRQQELASQYQQGKLKEYNQGVISYNELVAKYNELTTSYRQLASRQNSLAATLNSLLANLYQK